MKAASAKHRPANGKPPARDLEQISFYLGRAYYSYIGLLERMLAERGLDDHLQPGIGNVLFALFEQDDCTITHIAQRLRVSKSTMTGVVARIKRAGLVTARRDPDDGRAVRLQLTPLARSLEADCRRLAADIDQAITARMNRRQRSELRKLLAVLTDTISDEIEHRDQSRT